MIQLITRVDPRQTWTPPEIGYSALQISYQYLLSTRSLSVFRSSIYIILLEYAIPDKPISRCYYRITLIGRDIATSLSIPSKIKGAVDVVEFCNHVQRIWRDIVSPIL